MLLAALMGAALTGVHAYGAWRGIQPPAETVEIALYGGLTVWAFLLWSRMG